MKYAYGKFPKETAVNKRAFNVTENINVIGGCKKSGATVTHAFIAPTKRVHMSNRIEGALEKSPLGETVLKMWDTIGAAMLHAHTPVSHKRRNQRNMRVLIFPFGSFGPNILH